MPSHLGPGNELQPDLIVVHITPACWSRHRPPPPALIRIVADRDFDAEPGGTDGCSMMSLLGRIKYLFDALVIAGVAQALRKLPTCRDSTCAEAQGDFERITSRRGRSRMGLRVGIGLLTRI